jgi:hypothetical protein
MSKSSYLTGGTFNVTPPVLNDGDLAPFQFDAAGNLKITTTGGSSANPAASPTGAAVPASADYQGINIGGILNGVTGLALGATTKAPTIAIVDGSGNQITSFGGGTQFADSVASGAAPTGTLVMGWDSVNSKIRALKVDASQNLLVDIANATLAVTQSTSPWVISFTAPQHVIVDSGSITVSGTVTVSNPGTQYASGAAVAIPTGTQVIGWDGTNVWGVSATHFAVTSVNALATQIIDANGVQIAGQTWGSLPGGANADALNVNAAIWARVAGSTAAIPTLNSFNLSAPAKAALDSNFLTVKGVLISTAAAGIIQVGVVGNAGSIFDFADNTASGASPDGILTAGWDSAALRVRALKVDANQNLDVNVNAALPAGTNVIGHVIVDSGAITVSGTITVSNPSVQFADSAASGATPTGTLSMAWDTVNSKIRALQTDTNQRLLVTPVTGGQAPSATQPIFARTAMDVNILSVHDTAVPTAAALADNIVNPTTAMFAANTLGWDATNSVWRRLQVAAGTGDLLQAITDGTNGPVAVKAASIAALTTDASLVVALSPNSNTAKITDGTNGNVAIYSDWLRNQLEVRDSKLLQMTQDFSSRMLGELQAIRYGIGKLIGEMLTPDLTGDGRYT